MSRDERHRTCPGPWWTVDDGVATMIYDNVAVPVDGSPVALHALATARRLARMFDASLTIVTVRGPDDRESDVLARLDAAQRGAGTDVTTLVLDGPDVRAALASYDAEEPATLLCMTTRGRGALRRALLGSTALAVVERTPRAVALVGPRCAGDPGAPVDPVIACLDGTTAAESILPWALDWARTASARLWLLRAVYPLGEPGVASPPSTEQTADLRYLEQLARSLEVDDVDVRALTEPAERPVDVITDALRGLPDAVLAVATSHPGRVVDLARGSLTSEVLRRAEVPVLVASQGAAP